MALDRLHVHGSLAEYLDDLRPPPRHIAERYESLALHDNAEMMTHPDLGRLLATLTLLSGGRAALEVGTFVGISAAWIAGGLGSDGRFETLEISDEHADLAEKWFGRVGIADLIAVHRGPAAETMQRLGDSVYDLCYIDADKPGYLVYLDEATRVVRPGGVIVADNVLSGGRVADPDATGNAAALREFTRAALDRDDLTTCVLPIGDGITLSVVR